MNAYGNTRMQNDKKDVCECESPFQTLCPTLEAHKDHTPAGYLRQVLYAKRSKTNVIYSCVDLLVRAPRSPHGGPDRMGPIY